MSKKREFDWFRAFVILALGGMLVWLLTMFSGLAWITQ